MAQDVVGRGDVEVEVRQPEMEQKILALEGQGVTADRQCDLTTLAAVDLGSLEALHVVEGLGDALLKLRKARLLVAEFDDLDSGETRRRVLGEIGRELNL